MNAIPPPIRLAVSKALRQMAFIERSYSLKALPSDVDALAHDIGLMALHGDLKEISLELLDSQHKVLFDFRVHFNGDQPGHVPLDSARGIEVPVMDIRRIAGARFVVQRRMRSLPYARLLRLAWSDAQTLDRVPSDTIDSEHAAKITVGRQQAAFHVSQQFRWTLVVTRSGTHGFAFGRDVSGRVPAEVFLHRRYATAGCNFEPGKRLTALVIQTPLGLQARAIRPCQGNAAGTGRSLG